MLYGDVHIYAGINAASQEVFSRTLGVVNPTIKNVIVCYYKNPKPLHVTIGARDQDWKKTDGTDRDSDSIKQQDGVCNRQGPEAE